MFHTSRSSGQAKTPAGGCRPPLWSPPASGDSAVPPPGVPRGGGIRKGRWVPPSPRRREPQGMMAGRARGERGTAPPVCQQPPPVMAPASPQPLTALPSGQRGRAGAAHAQAARGGRGAGRGCQGLRRLRRPLPVPVPVPVPVRSSALAVSGDPRSPALPRAGNPRTVRPRGAPRRVPGAEGGWWLCGGRWRPPQGRGSPRAAVALRLSRVFKVFLVCFSCFSLTES